MTLFKQATVTKCTFTSEWLNPASKKIIYYHEVTLDNGETAICGTIEKNSTRIAVGAKLEYTINANGKMSLNSSSNDKKNEKASDEKPTTTTNKIKGQEAFLGYAWSYAKDLIIAGKTMEDVEELNNVARYIYSEIGKMLVGE